MATKDNWLPPEECHIFGGNSDSNGKYSNLNLNQNCFLGSNYSTTGGRYLRNNVENHYENDSYDLKKKKDFKEIKSEKTLSLNWSEYSESTNFKKQNFKNAGDSNASSSTLSLHIAFYENSIDSVAEMTDENEGNEKKGQIMGLTKKWKNAIFGNTSSVLQDSFEFPRQQKDGPSTPEIAQFKASQKLLNPNLERLKNDYSNDKLFALVFKGGEKYGLNVSPLPDVITVPRTKGRHLMLYTTTADTNIKRVYKDDLSHWKGNPHLRNFLITIDGDNVTAVMSSSANIPTQAQCYSATHFDYLLAGNKVTKKVFSATTPSSKMPLPGTLIAIYFDIEKDLVPINTFSPQTVSPSARKRSNVELKNEKSDDPQIKKAKKEIQSTPKRSISNIPLFGINLNEVIDSASSPGSSKSPTVVAQVESNNKLFDMSIKLKDVEKELHERQEKAKKTEEKLKEYHSDVYNLKKQMERLKVSSAKKEEELELELANSTTKYDKTNADYCLQLQHLKDQCKIDSEKIKHLEAEIATLKKLIEEHNAKTTVVELKKNGRYKPEVRLAMSELETIGIRDHAVGPVIQIVSNMLGFTPNAVPSARTVANNSFLTKYLNIEQLREMFDYVKSRGIPTTLCTDESIRNSEILHNFIMDIVDETDQRRSYVLGTLKGLDKSTNTILELLNKVVKMLDSDEDCSHWEKLMMNLGNMMSDQASTNTKLAKELPKLKEIIAKNGDNWDQLTVEQQQELTTVRSFACQLHLLQNMTPVVINSLLDHEKAYRNDEELKQPLIFVLLQEIARFLGNRASSKYDVAKSWKAFCDQHNIIFANVPDFKGHRFNILFAIAAAVFYLLDDIIKFYDDHKTQMHDAKIDIGAALKDPLVLSQLHLLAAINAYVTGPMTRLTENSPTINSLTEHAKSLIKFLERVSEDPLQMIYGYAPFDEFEEAEEVTARSKAHIEHLDYVSPIDPEIIADATEFVCEDLLEYCKKKFAPFLEGGEHYSSTADLRSVPRSNRRCEMIFGFLGSDCSVAPRKRIARRDIKVQAKVNKVFEWLKAKSPEERERILKEAIEAASTLRVSAAEDEKVYKDAVWKKLLQKKEEDDRKAAIKSRKAQEAFNKVQQNGGIWRDVEQMNAVLAPLKATKKRMAVEDQIRCHKLYLQNHPTNYPLFIFSANNVKKDTATLIRNLTSLIITEQALAENVNDDDNDED
uniref:Uncharacterized protein n=1 Tax=Panagrolaimus sp. ES5 TaxID=591445 RepID=A0AC34FTC3_9BILA